MDWTSWLLRNASFQHSLHNAQEIGRSLQHLENALFFDQTRVAALLCPHRTAEPSGELLDLNGLQGLCSSHTTNASEFFVVTKVSGIDPSSDDGSEPGHKLRVSHGAFQLLSDRCDLSPSFLVALARSHLSSPRSFENDGNGFKVWYMVPFRVQVDCTDTQGRHTNSTAGSNQMNAFHYLHLPRPGILDSGKGCSPVDIRGSRIDTENHSVPPKELRRRCKSNQLSI